MNIFLPIKNVPSGRVRASFTIEAAVIVPITLLVIVWLINTSIAITGKVQAAADYVSFIIQSAPDFVRDEKKDSDVPESVGVIIDTDLLDGREVLLKYKLLKDGYQKISGGLSDED